MGIENPVRAWEYPAAIVAVVALAFVVRAGSRSWPTVTRLAVVGMLAVALFLAFKHGFVRHDGHSTGFFAFILIALLPFASAEPWRRAAAALGVFVIFLWAVGIGSLDLFDPLGRAGRLVQQVSAVVDPERRDELREQGLQRIRGTYEVDQGALDLLEGHSVHVNPDAVSIAWAYEDRFGWSPLPIFQQYAAYTAWLDQRNAARLSSPEAPERILRQLQVPIDGRQPHFESPAATLAMICHYQEIYASSTWQVLERVENRCGDREHIRTVEVKLDEFVTSPIVDETKVLYAQVDGVRDGPWERLRGMLYKLDPVFIEVREPAGLSHGRLVPETAEGPLVMAVPPDHGYSAPFAYPSRTDALRVWYGGEDRARDDATVQVSFYSMDLRP